MGSFKKTSILLIKADALGDFILWLDSAKEYKKLYKNRNIVLVCTNTYKPLAEQLQYFDIVIGVEYKSAAAKYMDYLIWKDLIKTISELRKYHFDKVIQCYYSRTWFCDMLSVLVRASVHITISADCADINATFKQITDRTYTKKVMLKDHNIHELQRHAKMIRALGDTYYRSSVPQLPVDTVYKNKIDECYFVLFPGGSFGLKQWPPVRFAKIADHISTQTNWKGVICGGKKDRATAKKIISSLKSCDLIDLTGKTDLINLINAIGNAQLVISNDTSGIHIAAATNVPSVCIVGGWHFRRFLPYSVDWMHEKVQLPIPVYKIKNVIIVTMLKHLREIRHAFKNPAEVKYTNALMK